LNFCVVEFFATGAPSAAFFWPRAGIPRPARYPGPLDTSDERSTARRSPTPASHPHALDMSWCEQITDAGLASRSPTPALRADHRPRAPHRHPRAGHEPVRADTDAGVAHLSGIHALDMSRRADHRRRPLAPQRHPRAGHEPSRSPTPRRRPLAPHRHPHAELSECALITVAGLAHLTGIYELYVRDCNPATIAAAHALRLIAYSENRVFVGRCASPK
jgi:hypothetical protein